MTARARSSAVLAIIAGGALAIISSTQTWLDVTLDAGATAALQVAGAKAFTMLAPLSLAALALGLALTVVGRALRYAFGALALLIGGTLTIAAAASRSSSRWMRSPPRSRRRRACRVRPRSPAS